MADSTASAIENFPRLATALARVPGYIYAITALTAVYLIVELSFNARLLDVVAGASSPDVVHSIEYWGRGISGAALALAVWGMGILPNATKRHWRPQVTLLLLLLTAAASGLTMWNVQKYIVDYFINRSSGSERRVAMKLNLIEHNATLGYWRIKNIALRPETLHSPEGKSFMALMPFMASAFNGVEDKIDLNLSASIQAEMAMKLGGPSAFYDSVFTPSAQAVYDSYKSYADGYNRRQDALAAVPGRAQTAWSNYTAMLTKQGYTPQTVPRQLWPHMAESVIKSGVPVSPGWAPYDKAGFAEAVQRSVRAEADATYSAHTRLPNGQPIPDGLSLQAFEALPANQQKWHETLKLPGTAMLSHTLNGGAFVETVFTPIAHSMALVSLKDLQRPSADYVDGGPEERHGRDAMALLIVPPIALAFSLAGALVHLFKITNYSVRIGVGWAKSSVNLTPIIAILVIGIALSAFLVTNDVTRSDLFAFDQREMFSKGVAAHVQAVVCRWVIQAQPYFWPVNEWIRVHVLQGFDF